MTNIKEALYAAYRKADDIILLTRQLPQIDEIIARYLIIMRVQAEEIKHCVDILETAYGINGNRIK